MFTFGARALVQMVLHSDANSTPSEVYIHAHYCKIVGEVLANHCKTCAHKFPVPSLVPEYKVLILYSDTRTVHNSGMGTWKKSVFTLVPGLELDLGTRPGHLARVPGLDPKCKHHI